MFVAALKLFASPSAHNSPHFWASNAPFPTWAWGWPHFIPPLPKPFIRFHCCIFRCPHGLHVNSCIPNPPLPQFGPAAPGFLPVSPKGTKEFPHLTLLRNADRNRLRGNPFLGHTGTFMLSLLPPNPALTLSHQESTTRLRIAISWFGRENAFCPHVLLLQINLPAGGLLTCALQETTSALLQALCTPRACGKRDTKSPLLLKGSQGWASAWNSWVAKKLWNSTFTPLEPHSLPIKASFKSDKFLFLVIHPWGF